MKVTIQEAREAINIIRKYRSQTNDKHYRAYIRQLCIKLDTTIAVIQSKDRSSEHVYRRIIIAHSIIRKYPELTLKKIGELLNRDHCSIIHYNKKYYEYIMYQDFQELNERVNS